jgi:hypothetical protein
VYTLTPIDESLNRAFQLAHFITGNKQTAIRVVSQAMAKVEVAAAAQGKRLYYRSAGRSFGPARYGNKVTFSELHLLQRLVYIESEPFEREKERAGSAALQPEDLIIHFVKHLVRITSKRNAFYVTLGISRLLYNFTTPETMSIYNVVVQDPERVKDDYYYRSRKGVLLREMKERFGDLVRTCHGQRGEEKFQSDPNSVRFVDLVRECLSFFTPWMTMCSVPPRIDPVAVGVPPLSSATDINEHEVELNRIHAVLHPDCYQRLTQALGFETPDRRLEVPQFCLSNENKNGGEAVRTPIVGLREEDLTAIKSDLNELAERRKKTSAGFLQVRVDGTECACLDIKKASRVRFNVDNSNELLEIWTRDKSGDLLLASQLLTSERDNQSKPTTSSITLEGGQKLSIDIASLGTSSNLVIDISYQETNPFPATRLALQRFLGGSALNQSLGERALSDRRRSAILVPVFAVILFLAITALVLTYMLTARNPLVSSPVANVNETQSSTAERNDTNPNGSQQSQANETTVARRGISGSRVTESPAPHRPASAAVDRRLPPNGDSTRQTSTSENPSEAASSGGEATRAITRAEPRLSLSDVKSIFVEFAGNAPPQGQTLREVLVEKLQASGRLTSSTRRDEADAVLKVTMMQSVSKPSPVFALQLINAQGQIIWPLKGTNKTYSAASMEQVGTEILRDLLADMKDKRRR